MEAHLTILTVGSTQLLFTIDAEGKPLLLVRPVVWTPSGPDAHIPFLELVETPPEELPL